MMRWKSYLPRVANELSPADAFIAAWLAALGDKAHDTVQDSRLMAAATKHADWLAANHVTANRHVGENNSTPNERVRAQGFALPHYWPIVGNQVESVGECYDGPAEALRLLLDSPHHRVHLLREEWFAGHRVYGLGNSSYFYVVVSAPIEVI